MRKRGVALVLVLAFCFFSGEVVLARMDEDIQKYPSCKYCGMDRQQFAFSRMFIEYDDGTFMAACSIHCAAVDLATNIDKTPKTLQVGDFNTKKLIDAESATWVIGGSKQGVMTKRAKWAFEKKEDAEVFAKVNNGAVSTFDEAMKAAYEDMYSDTKMIREKRKMMKTKMQSSAEHKHHQ